MAEIKRQNQGGKVPVATPNIGPSGMVSLETALSTAIGARIRLTTTLPNHPTLEGTLHSVSPALSILALSLPTTPPSYHILSIPTISNFTLLSLPTSPPPPLAPLPPSYLQTRLTTTVERLKAEDARRGKGVGKEAQAIFDALSRTLPTRWEGNSIVVNDSVHIGKPYRADDCVVGKGAAATVLGRVKKVLEYERKKLGEKGGKPAVPTVVPATGPRKGG